TTSSRRCCGSRTVYRPFSTRAYRARPPARRVRDRAAYFGRAAGGSGVAQALAKSRSGVVHHLLLRVGQNLRDIVSPALQVFPGGSALPPMRADDDPFTPVAGQADVAAEAQQFSEPRFRPGRIERFQVPDEVFEADDARFGAVPGAGVVQEDVLHRW